MTLFWPINFQRLQLQNNSALGVEVNPEVYLCTLSFESKKFGCTYINNYSGVKPENIIKLKYYMHSHGRSQGQICAEVNTLITCPVGYVLNCSLWRPNILLLFKPKLVVSLVIVTQCSCSATLFETATQDNMIWCSVTKMFCGSITKSLPRQVLHYYHISRPLCLSYMIFNRPVRSGPSRCGVPLSSDFVTSSCSVNRVTIVVERRYTAKH